MNFNAEDFVDQGLLDEDMHVGTTAFAKAVEEMYEHWQVCVECDYAGAAKSPGIDFLIEQDLDALRGVILRTLTGKARTRTVEYLARRLLRP